MTPCEVCGARVSQLRRGRCWGCYTRWADERPVGVGAACAACGERRRGFLKQIELLGSWAAMCHNCAARTFQLQPAPRSLEDVRSRLTRERRAGDRRAGKKDTRVFPRERRGLERRSVGRADGDDLLLVDDDLLVEIADAEPPGDGETRIVQRA